jgi:dihydrofolate synthase/folylpolyglutamate synthase
LKLNLLGAFQRENAARALAAVHAFNTNIPAADIRKGLQKSNIPGRMEVVQENPTVILDGAHNADKIRAASKAVETRFSNRKRHVLFGLKKGKAYRDILPAVIQQAETLIITTFSTELWEPLEPEILISAVQELDPLINITIEPDPIRAIKIALRICSLEDLIWVTGSLYLVGNVRDYWHPPARLLENRDEIQ